MAVTAFRPSSAAPWIPTPYQVLPAPQGWGGSVQESRTFSLFLPAPPRPFWESLGTGLPTSGQPIKQRVSFVRLGKESQCPATPSSRSRKDDPEGRVSSIFCKNFSKEQSWERKGREEEARCVATSSFQPPQYLYLVSVSLPLTACKNL